MFESAFFFENCRNGFYHVGVLYQNGTQIASYKVHYINRTWESYEGRNARRSVCEKELKQLESRAHRLAMIQTGRRRRCPAVDAAAAVILGTIPAYTELKAHYNSL